MNGNRIFDNSVKGDYASYEPAECPKDSDYYKIDRDSENVYCVKCKKKTGNKGPVMCRMLKNGIRAIEVKCIDCLNKKNQFLPNLDI